jgi:uncharacterized damage-inducible protein DinB
MTRPVLSVAIVLLLAAPLPAVAQSGSDPMRDSIKTVFDMLKVNLSRTAEKVPEDLWSFKPTPEVRSFAQLIGHVADGNFGICGAAAGEKPPQSGVEKAMTSKADLSKALNESIAYCDKVIAGMDDKKGMEPVKFFGGNQTRLGVLAFNNAHSYEHYGNLVTYMRLKGIVPPSSEKSGSGH